MHSIVNSGQYKNTDSKISSPDETSGKGATLPLATNCSDILQHVEVTKNPCRPEPRGKVKFDALPEALRAPLQKLPTLDPTKHPTLYEVEHADELLRVVSTPTFVSGSYCKASLCLLEGPGFDPNVLYIDLSLRELLRQEADEVRIERNRAALYPNQLTKEDLNELRINSTVFQALCKVHQIEPGIPLLHISPPVAPSAFTYEHALSIIKQADLEPGRGPRIATVTVDALRLCEILSPQETVALRDTKSKVTELVNEGKITPEQGLSLRVKTRYSSAKSIAEEQRLLCLVESPLAALCSFRLDGRTHQIVPWYEGGDLTTFDMQRLTLDERRITVRSIGAKVSADAQRGQAKGVTHYDIKRDNVYINSAGEAVLGDWGLAVEAKEGAIKDVRGTPGALAPELLGIRGMARQLGPPRGGPKCDVYSLGLLLFTLASGREGELMPFGMNFERHIAHRRLLAKPAGQYAELYKEWHDFDPELARFVVRRMLTLDPDSRCTMEEAMQFMRELQPPGSEEQAAANRVLADQVQVDHAEIRRLKAYAKSYGLPVTAE